MEKTERFGFCLTINEKNLVTMLAELEGGLSQAALIRRLIHNEAMKHGFYPGSHMEDFSGHLIPNGESK